MSHITICNFRLRRRVATFLNIFLHCQLIDEGDSAGRSETEEDAQAPGRSETKEDAQARRD